MSRFFVKERDIGDSEIVITDSGDLRHMRKGLRLKPGDEVEEGAILVSGRISILKRTFFTKISNQLLLKTSYGKMK